MSRRDGIPEVSSTGRALYQPDFIVTEPLDHAPVTPVDNPAILFSGTVLLSSSGVAFAIYRFGLIGWRNRSREE